MHVAERRRSVKTKQGNINLVGIAYFDSKEWMKKAIKALREKYPDLIFRSFTNQGNFFVHEHYWIAGQVPFITTAKYGFVTYDQNIYDEMFKVCLEYDGSMV